MKILFKDIKRMQPKFDLAIFQFMVKVRRDGFMVFYLVLFQFSFFCNIITNYYKIILLYGILLPSISPDRVQRIGSSRISAENPKLIGITSGGHFVSISQYYSHS